jgi:hypothetical protein
MKRKQRLTVAMTAMSIAALGCGFGATGAQATASADLATTIGNVWAFGAGTEFTVTVANNGPSAAQNVTVTDSWRGGGGFWVFGGLLVKTPAGVSCVTPAARSLVRVVTCSLSSLASGQSIVLRLGLSPTLFTGSGAVFDSATAASATPDPNSTNNTAQFTAIVRL